jgi:hypothetical protein
VDRFGPAALGSVFRAVEAGYRQIGLVDGFFGNVPGVWHKEILHALQTAEVWGAASTGALRAAELHRYGMRGCGAIFRLLRSGSIADDDEVCVLHAIPQLDYAPLSHAMINVRATLRHLRLRSMITVTEERALSVAVKAMHFSDRTNELLDRVALEILGEARAKDVVTAFHAGFVDLKARDAGLLCRLMTARTPSTATRSGFVPTIFWQRQFEAEVADIPMLGSHPQDSMPWLEPVEGN